MKKQETIFFGNSGLTSTSANYIANKAKEYMASINLKLENLNFVNESVNFNGNNDTTKNTLTKVGITENDLDKIVKEDINILGDMTSLIAWLREAIKAKENNLNYLTTYYSYEDYLKENNIEENCPIREDLPTNEDIIASWPSEKRKKYYDLEARCSVIGKLIHNDSPLVKAREQILDAINNPNVVDNSNESVLIYSRVPSINGETIDNILMELQNKHRSYQAELNGLKHEIETEVNNKTKEINSKYLEDYKNYKNNYKYNQDKYQEELKVRRIKMSDEKIIIPDSLKKIYDFVNNL